MVGLQAEAHVAAGALVGVLLGWLVTARYVAAFLARKETLLRRLSREYDDLLRQLEPLRAEEQRVKPMELLDESTRASDEIENLRRGLRELGLYDGPSRALPPTPKPVLYPPPAVSDEHRQRGSDWWREQP